jgi:hypothetical protein
LLPLQLEDDPIPDNVLCEMAVQAIDDRNLPPLTGKHRRRIQNQDHQIPPKGHAFNVIINVLKSVF